MTQGHTAVTIGTDMIVFGGVVNGERVNEVSVDRLRPRLHCAEAQSPQSRQSCEVQYRHTDAEVGLALQYYGNGFFHQLLYGNGMLPLFACWIIRTSIHAPGHKRVVSLLQLTPHSVSIPFLLLDVFDPRKTNGTPDRS